MDEPGGQRRRVKRTVAIIGGGSAGLTAARMAYLLGARVLFAMGDRGDLASLCVNFGCMPSKALFAPIDVMHHARRQHMLHVAPKQPRDYLAHIVQWKNREIATLRAYRAAVVRELGGPECLVLQQKARFAGPNELDVGGKRYSFDAAIVATGSTPAMPPVQGLLETRGMVWGNKEILENAQLPESLAVIGAGAVGLEFALRYGRLGCDVTLLTRGCVLPSFPEQFGQRLASVYQREGIQVLTGLQAVRIVRERNNLLRLEAEGTGGMHPVVTERVLMATGRRPNTESLDLKAAGVETNSRGALEIDSDMRIRGHQNLFAAGDVAGERMVVHQAHIEAGIAAENSVTGGKREWKRRANLQVIFSDPEFAFAGITPEAAARRGLKVRSASAQSSDVRKLVYAGDDAGFGEFYADAETGRLLGAGLLCNSASELIHLPGYAIDHEHTVTELADAEFYHPTRMGIVPEIVDKLCREFGSSPLCRPTE